ncbi:MAG: hypothetical protein KTR31_03135 [Myxococcales bacterium]|nr:hypothetical protein [Myxococcales bacterium]
MPPLATVSLLCLTSGSASAAEVQFEGFYRARARALDTLSLDRENAQSEGLAAYVQHRLWLRPRFVLSDQVALFADIRALDGVAWGRQPSSYDDFTGSLSPVFEYGLQPPTTDADDTSPPLDLSLWRAWGEIHTEVGRFTFGRVPLHWGLGLWLNDGVSVDPMFADHGDTTDRLMWEYLLQDQIYVRAAIDIPVQRFIGFEDDTMSYQVSAAYRTEDITAGVLVQYDRTSRRDELEPLNIFTIDAAADITLGRLHGAAEVVGHFGGGDLEAGLENSNITALGAALHADLELDAFTASVRGGLATGDGTPNDLQLRTYTFDRDYSVGMFLFEHPLPTLAEPQSAANDDNQGRDFTSTRSGTAISNALFIKPTISREIVDGLYGRVSWLGARTAKGDNVTANNASYGNEFQLGASYAGIDHLELDAQLGVFLPGTFYSIDTTEAPFANTGFDDTVVGFQLAGRIRF